MGVAELRVAGVEADDVIGTVATRAVAAGFHVAIASPDKARHPALHAEAAMQRRGVMALGCGGCPLPYEQFCIKGCARGCSTAFEVRGRLEACAAL